MGKSNKKKKWGMVLIIVLFLLAAGFAAFSFRLRHSIRIYASRDIIPDNDIIYYRQDDPLWGNEKLGSSDYDLASSGCLLSCIAASLSMQSGMEETPYTLNIKFSQENVYDAEGNIQWDNLKKMEEYEVIVYEDISARLIDECLLDGKYPIVRVRMHGFGNFHYVLIVQAEDGKYKCMDPLCDGMTELADYGNRIYAIRCVYPAALPDEKDPVINKQPE